MEANVGTTGTYLPRELLSFGRMGFDPDGLDRDCMALPDGGKTRKRRSGVCRMYVEGKC